jgi:hypothetical protein
VHSRRDAGYDRDKGKAQAAAASKGLTQTKGRLLPLRLPLHNELEMTVPVLDISAKRPTPVRYEQVVTVAVP